MWNRYLTRMQTSKLRWPGVVICSLWLICLLTASGMVMSTTSGGWSAP